ncbi:MAG: metallophosphoesterase, partial [Pseudomonadota bacterium]
MALNSAKRVLRLPDKGKLLVCTDLHGNLRDFNQMREIFVNIRKKSPFAYLLFTGDLIHGPSPMDRADWPLSFGEYYEDQSGEVVDGFLQLKRDFEGQVNCLLGNHEHSHVGGPHTPKFWNDETAHFERTVGPERAERYKDFFRSFPLVATTSCGVALTHAAPNVKIDSVETLES